MVRYDWMEEGTDFFYVDISNQEEKNITSILDSKQTSENIIRSRLYENDCMFTSHYSMETPSNQHLSSFYNATFIL